MSSVLCNMALLNPMEDQLRGETPVSGRARKLEDQVPQSHSVPYAGEWAPGLPGGGISSGSQHPFLGAGHIHLSSVLSSAKPSFEQFCYQKLIYIV